MQDFRLLGEVPFAGRTGLTLSYVTNRLLLHQQLALPDIHSTILENLVHSLFQLIPGNTLLQDYLKETASACSGDKLTADQILAGNKHLINTGIGASCIQLLGKLPMFVQKLCKIIYASTLQLETHEGCNRCHLLQSLYAFWSGTNVASYYITQQVSGKSSLSGID